MILNKSSERRKRAHRRNQPLRPHRKRARGFRQGPAGKVAAGAAPALSPSSRGHRADGLSRAWRRKPLSRQKDVSASPALSLSPKAWAPAPQVQPVPLKTDIVTQCPAGPGRGSPGPAAARGARTLAPRASKGQQREATDQSRTAESRAGVGRGQ